MPVSNVLSKNRIHRQNLWDIFWGGNLGYNHMYSNTQSAKIFSPFFQKNKSQRCSHIPTSYHLQLGDNIKKTKTKDFKISFSKGIQILAVIDIYGMLFQMLKKENTHSPHHI